MCFVVKFSSRMHQSLCYIGHAAQAGCIHCAVCVAIGFEWTKKASTKSLKACWKRKKLMLVICSILTMWYINATSFFDYCDGVAIQDNHRSPYDICWSSGNAEHFFNKDYITISFFMGRKLGTMVWRRSALVSMWCSAWNQTLWAGWYISGPTLEPLC